MPDCSDPKTEPLGLSTLRHEPVGPSIRGMNEEPGHHSVGSELDLSTEPFWELHSDHTHTLVLRLILGERDQEHRSSSAHHATMTQRDRYGLAQSARPSEGIPALLPRLRPSRALEPLRRSDVRLPTLLSM